jgi:cytidylate kinase
MAIVTISREYGSGGKDIGKGIAQQSGYDFVDREQIFKDLEKEGKQWLARAEELDEHCPTLWERFDRSFSGFVALVEKIIYGYAQKNNVVIVGRGGNWLLRDIPHALRIRIVAPLEVRVERIMVREKTDKEAAARMIRQVDHERSCYINTVYHRNWSDPQDYDVLFDTGRLAFDDVVKSVIGVISDKDRAAGAEAKERVVQRALAAAVKARIAVEPQVFVPTLEVIHDGEKIVVRGIIHSPKEHELVENLARQAVMPVRVKCELHYRGQ